MHKNIKTVAGCFTNVTCNVTATDGRAVELTAYIAIGQERRPVPKAGAKLFAFPAVEYGQHLYEIRADGKPLIFGFLLVRPSAFPVAQGTVDYTLNATLDSVDALHVDIELTPGPRGYSAYEVAVMEGFVGSEAEWLEHMRQQTATLAVEKVTPLMERAETAAGNAEQSRTDAQTAETNARNYANTATAARNGAEQARTDAQTAETNARNYASTATAARNGAEQARTDAQTAETNARNYADTATAARNGAEQARTDAQTAEGNAKASANAAAADKAAAERAKQDAQASQSTAEEQAAIATKAAEDAQAPESIAAQSARPATMLLIKDELMSILGDAGLFDLDTDGQKIIVHTDRLSDDKLAAVTDMLARFVPPFIEVVQYNHTLKVPWEEWVPGYHPVEYIENKTESEVYVMTDVLLTETLETRIKLNSFGSFVSRAFGFVYFLTTDNVSTGYQLIWYQGRFVARMGEQAYYGGAANVDNEFVMNATNGTVSLNGEVVMGGFSYTIKDGYSDEQLRIPIFAGKYIELSTSPVQSWVGRIYKVEFYDNGKLLARFMPAVNEEGAPCMVDTVSKKVYYNEGPGDFIVPSESTTYSLRHVLPDWGKLTEHGLRRLYHAPAGYVGELIDYALENGFKPIVEPEKPEEGYWAPRWTETEDEIVLEWVETAPPADDYGLPDETLTNE